MEGREVVVIEWEGLYALYCQRCNQVTEIIRYDDYLRCGRCNHRYLYNKEHTDENSYQEKVEVGESMVEKPRNTFCKLRRK